MPQTDGAVNAGTYVASVTVNRNGSGGGVIIIGGGTTASVIFTVEKAPVTLSDTSATGITYGQTLADSTPSGSASYQRRDAGTGSFSAADTTGTFAWKNDTLAPEVADSDSTDFELIFTPDDANLETASGTAKLTVSRADIDPRVTIDGWTYGGAPSEPALTEGSNPGDGQVVYEYKEQTATEYSGAKPENAGNYTVRATISETANYNGGECTADFSIGKKDATVIPPKARELVYNGEEQKLVIAGSTDGGRLMYSTKEESSGYLYGLPTAKDAGEYTVWYFATGNSNYNSSETMVLTVTIAPKSIEGAAVTLEATQLTYNGEEQAVSVTGVVIDDLALTADDYDLSGGTGKDKGEYTLTVTGKGNFADTAEAAGKTVTKAMTVSAANVSAVYDGEPH